MKYAIYSRKSVYTGKGESVENQIEMCRQYIHSKLGMVDAADITVYEDEGFSAKNTDRPQFQQMLQDLRLKRFECVVCYRLDRVSRNVSDFSMLIEELNRRGIAFVCIKEEFDTSKPMGKAMMYIASVFAQLERETIAERVRDNMLMLARTGRWLGGTTPTGYGSEKFSEIIIDGKVKTACRLKVNEGEIHVVTAIYEKFLELRSVSGVSKYLIKQKMTSRSGKFYSLLGIKEILRNPVYCIADKAALEYFRAQNADVCFEEKDCSDKLGLLSYNKRDYKKSSAPRRAVEEWVVSIGRHRGLISGEKWTATQALLAENIPTGKSPAKMHNGYSLLSGFIYCEKCGARMFAKARSGNAAQFDYICGGKMRGGKAQCDCQNLSGSQADYAVSESLSCRVVESAGIYRLLEKLKRELPRSSQASPISMLDDGIRKCSGEMDNLIGALAQSDSSPAFVGRIRDRILVLEEKLSELTLERDEMLKSGRAANRAEPQPDALASSLSSLRIGFGDLSIHEKRVLIRLVARKIVWDGAGLHIFMR